MDIRTRACELLEEFRLAPRKGRAFALIGGLSLALTALGVYANARYLIGYDAQVDRCLDVRWMVIDKWAVPMAAELKRGDLAAVVLTAQQIPSIASWKPQQVMVKRVLASEAGTVMHVSRDGISFEGQDGEKWQWGTTLELSPWLHVKKEAAFERDETLEAGHIFLMGDNPRSYDSRYYGQVDQSQIVGEVVWAF